MPYKSAKQRSYMHIHHPEIAKRWDRMYGKGKYKGEKPPGEGKAAFTYARRKNRRLEKRASGLPG